MARVARDWRTGIVFAIMTFFAAVAASAGDVHVSPQGTPRGDGSKDRPLDLASAMAGKGVNPGDTVWIAAGKYEGRFKTGRAGTKERPIIYRAAKGERVTLLDGVDLHAANVWLWGLEITGRKHQRPDPLKDEGWHGTAKTKKDAIHVHGRNTDYVKIINCVIHDYPGTGIGGWDVGRDHEYYGNLIYRNGVPGKKGGRGHCHAFYTQNTKGHGTKRLGDNIIFEGWALGVQAYGSAPALYGFRLDGNISFCNGVLSPYSPTQANLLVGGLKKTSTNIVLRNNATYHPPKSPSDRSSYGQWIKRSTDVGYVAKVNGDVLLEGNYFVGGTPAIHVVNWRKAVVRNNRFYSPGGTVHLVHPDELDFRDYEWDNNIYYACALPRPFTSVNNAYVWPQPDKKEVKRYTWQEWRQRYGFDRNSKYIEGKDGRPTELWLFKRINEFEPERVHLAIYNWPHRATVPLSLADVLEAGQKYRLLDVHDIWGKPEAEGAFDGKAVEIAIKGNWAPEFGCYILFREVTGQQVEEAKKLREKHLEMDKE